MEEGLHQPTHGSLFSIVRSLAKAQAISCRMGMYYLQLPYP